MNAPAGDPSRQLPTLRDGHSGYFVQHNQGKKGICVDPRQAEGLALLKFLIAKVDVMVKNFHWALLPASAWGGRWCRR